MGDLPSNRPPPTASGTLAKTPLIHLLVYALQNGLAGTVEFLSPDRRSAALLVLGGKPAKVRAGAPEAPTLEDLSDHIQRGLRQIASFPSETTYAYYDLFDALRGFGPDVDDGFDPLPMLWSLLRERPPIAHVDATLARIAAAALRLQPSANVERLALTMQQRNAVERLRDRPMRAVEMTTVAGLGETEARLLLYLLLITKQVELVRAVDTSTSGVRETIPSMWPQPRISETPPPRASAPPIAARPGASPRDSSPGSPVPAARPDAVPRASTPAPKLESPSRAPTPVPRRDQGNRTSTHAPGSNSASRASPIPTRRASGSFDQDARKRSSSPPSIRAQTSRPPNLSPPKGLSVELLERWSEIVGRAESIDRADYFSMLDLPREATVEIVASAFFSLAKKWHPDRLPPELAPVREACSRVFGRMSEAHATLTDAEKRTRYMKLLAEGSGSPEVQERLAKVVEAATAFQKAEVCLRRGDNTNAEIYALAAWEADPTQPDYLAMRAWLLALKPENQTPEKTAESIHMLSKAISMSGKSEKAHFWRGMLLRRLGKAEAAVRDFREAVELNPRNIDAAREVRLYRMRGGRFSSGPPPSDASQGARNMPSPRPGPNPSKSGVSPAGANKSGLFDRFFKK